MVRGAALDAVAASRTVEAEEEAVVRPIRAISGIDRWACDGESAPVPGGRPYAEPGGGRFDLVRPISATHLVSTRRAP
jgi:hypothetical protein